MLTSRFFAVVFLVLGALFFPMHALADDKPMGDPAVLKQLGDDDMDKAEFQDALDAYSKAYAIKQDPVLLYNQGRALQALHRSPQALEKLTEFKKRAPADLLAKVPKLDELIDEVSVHVSTLALTVDRPGASVKLDQVEIGTTPLGEVRVNAGTSKLEVSLEGYLTETRNVTLPGKGRAEVKIVLTPKDSSATLLVSSDVSGATVAVDDKVIGAVPSEVKVAPGPHTVRLSADGHDTVEVKAVVKAGESKKVDVPLPSSAVTKKAWFWVTIFGSAAVIGGVAGGTYAAVHEPPPGKGTIPPGTVYVQVFSPKIQF